MNTLLTTKVIAWSAIVMTMTGCPSKDPPSSHTAERAPAAEASMSSPTSSAASAAAASGEIVLHVDGLTCEGCAWQIRDTLEKVDGIRDVRTTVADKRVVVTYDSDRTSTTAVRQALDEVGYESVEINE